MPGSPVSSTLMSHLYFVTRSPWCTNPGPVFTERALCTCRVMLPGPLGAAAAAAVGAAAEATDVVAASCARGSSTVASPTASMVLIERPRAV